MASVKQESVSRAQESKVVIKPDELVNTVAKEDASLAVRRYFTIPGRDPFDEIEWERRDAFIPGKERPAFDQKGVEFPRFWSQTATNIVAQKYFRGRMSSPERESSVRQMIGRVVDTTTRWGREGGYFANDEEARDLRGRAQGDPRQPARRVQLPGVVQRRLRGEASVLGVRALPRPRLHSGGDGSRSASSSRAIRSAARSTTRTARPASSPSSTTAASRCTA